MIVLPGLVSWSLSAPIVASDSGFAIALLPELTLANPKSRIFA
jgi:hypothetical protein